MNEIRVLLFARARDLAGVEAVTLMLASGADVAGVRQTLAARFPKLAEWLPRCAIGVNGEYAGDETAIPPRAEIAVLPPVSGGS
jgi:molybdopterin converting factor subunit 1